MVELETNTEELLTNTESTETSGEESNPLGEESNTGGNGKSRGKKESIKTKEYRKKKQEALEGKDKTDARGHEEDSEGKHGHGDSGKGDSADKASGSGPQNQSSLQSGQTTVQFSSGGGVGSFGSLLALFASSASLIRAESGFISGLVHQTTNVNLQNILRTLGNQTGSLIGEEGKNVKYIGNVIENVIESSGKQLNIEFGGGIVARVANNIQDNVSNVLKVISSHASDQHHDISNIDKIPFYSTVPLTIYISFNPNTFFFTETTPFAFSNSPRTTTQILGTDNKPILGTDGNPAVTLKNVNPDIIDTYFEDAGLTKSNSYSYVVISPIATEEGGYIYQPIAQPDGLSVSRENDLSVHVFSAPKVVGTQILGITLTPKGDLYANVLKPMSVLVEITSNEDTLPVRINAGPGEVLLDTNNPLATNDFPGYPYFPYTGFLNGLHEGDSDRFAPTVFQDYKGNKIVGNASAITFNSQDKIIGNSFVIVDSKGTEFGVSQYGIGNLVYIKGLGAALGAVVLGGFYIDDTYTFPSNTIFRHIGNTNETVPTSAAYGNFSSFSNIDFPPPAITNSTFTLYSDHQYNLTLGGNVLDVFGTKYGVGDVLDLYLGSSLSGPNNITMGGNTLAGFGTSFGDLNTLTVSAPQAFYSTTLTFNGNILWVDKDVGSTLYPHLKDLVLKSNLTADSNLKIVFEDSIIHGNIGRDIFYGDIDKLGDIHDPLRSNAFVTGVSVEEVGEGVHRHIVTTPTYRGIIPESSTTDEDGNVTIIEAHEGFINSTNSITWANNVYVGGADPDHASSKNVNTYHFTLLGTDDKVAKPIMLGHDLITEFNASLDTLSFQLTPALFRSLDVDHNKIITPSDLNSGLIKYEQSGSNIYFDQLSAIYNPLNYGSVLGATLNFTGGGSLSLQGNQALANFNDILHLETNVVLTYIPIANLAPEQFTPNVPILTPPPPPTDLSIPTPPYIYGNGPDNLAQGPNNPAQPYYLELDNYFANSLYAHYTHSSLIDTLTGESIEGPQGVLINDVGTITVNTHTPYFVPLVITATDEHGAHVTSDPLLFGFLNAPITQAPEGVLGDGTMHPLFGTSNILIGGLNSKIVGGPSDTNTNPVGLGGESHNELFTYGSNMIVDTVNSTTAKAWGDFKTVVLTAPGQYDVTTTQSVSDPGIIKNDTFTFRANAFYVNGTVFGVATSLEVDALGGNDSVIKFGQSSPEITLDVRARFEDNHIDVGSQVIYGNGVGTLTGAFQDIIIKAIPGTPLTYIKEGTGSGSGSENISIISGFDIPSNGIVTSFTGTINTSSSIQGNYFNFGETQITIIGDTTTQISKIVANVENLIITAKNLSFKILGSTLTNISKATFADNHFNFDDATLKGGEGTTNYFGHLAKFGDAYDHDHYGGFAKGVIVSYEDSHLTIADTRNNTITWGNDDYTGGTGADTYNFTLVGDYVTKFPVMQGFDTIHDFDFAKDTIVFNITRNLFDSLGMNLNDTPFQLITKLGNKNVSASGSSTINIQFQAPPADPEAPPAPAVPYGSLSIDKLNAEGWVFTNLASLNEFSQQHWARDSVVINAVGEGYSPPEFNTAAIVAFDPVFLKVDQTLAFESFISNADTDSLTWGLAVGTVLPPEFVLTLDGTLQVFSNSGGLTPVDAYISVTVHDDISPLNITTIPSIHIFALNATSQQAIRDSSVQGSTATEIFETNQPGNVIHGGGADIPYHPMDPLAPLPPLIYGSKLIYDISEGGHTVIGDVENILFLNTSITATTPVGAAIPHAVSNLDGQSITFGPNMFNINSGGHGVIYGNAIGLALVANAGNNGHGLLIDASISENKFYFGPNTMYTVGSATHGAGDSFDVYGVLNKLSLIIDNPSNEGTVGDAHIKDNEFDFGINKLYGSSNAMTLNPGIGVLNIENNDVATHDPDTENLTPISGNKFTFHDSILTGGTASTTFNADIADLSNTAFVTGTVTFRDDVLQPVQVTDNQGNVITWGNNTYTILNGSQASTLTFTLLSVDEDGNDAAMQGNAKVVGYRTTDELHFKLAPTIFKALNPDFDRKLSDLELQDPTFLLFPDDLDLNKTTITFAASLAAGSIILMGHNYSNIGSLGNVTAELAYTPTPITVHNPAPDLSPLIFVSNEGNTNTGVYGNILDNYFDHIDIGDENSTYAVTTSSSYEQLIDPKVLLNTDSEGVPGLFGIWGTATATDVSSPILAIINVKPHDVNDLENTANVDLLVAAFNGIKSPDGTLIGSASEASYLHGTADGQTLIGNTPQVVVSALNENITLDGETYGTDLFGGNLIINTNTDDDINTVNKSYGVAPEIKFDLDTSVLGSSTLVTGTMNFSPNAQYVNGIVVGIADKFIIEAQNTIEGEYSSLQQPGSFESNTRLADGTFYFGAQTIFGQGTLIGDLNLFHISVIGNTTATVTGPGAPFMLYINAFTEVRENTFNFSPTEIIVLGDEHSVILPHINSLSFFLKNGTFFSDPIAQLQLNAPAVIEKNNWIFEDSVAVGGSGGVDYYSDINDLSSTSFWRSDALVMGNTGDSHVYMIDAQVEGFTNMGNNTIVWGNNEIHLSHDVNSHDIIHVNVLRDLSGKLGFSGNLEVYDFNPAKDIIHFNLSSNLYRELNGGSAILKGLLTAGALDSHANVVSDIDTRIDLNFGSLYFHEYNEPGQDTLASFSNIQVGTTLAGNRASVNNFTIAIPTSISDFKEFDHITQFNPTQDFLRFVLSPTAYNSLTQYGLLGSPDLISNFSTGASTPTGGIVIDHSTVPEYPVQNDATYTGATVDSIINFVANDITSGSVTLHNVDLTDLGASYIKLGQLATSATDNFYFVVPGDDFSTFTAHTFISGFDNISADRDNIEITVSKDLFEAINPTGTQAPALSLSSKINIPGIGGVAASQHDGSTDLVFKIGSAVAGIITLEGVTTNLNGLDTHLHLGYLDTGTDGTVDTFAFNLTGASFGTFNQFDHIREFNPLEDILRITVPVDLYYSINTEGTLSGAALTNALALAATTSNMGGIFTGTTSPHYDLTGFDTVLSFQNANSPDVTGSITLHGVNVPQLETLGSHFQFGSMQDGGSGVDTFSFNTSENAVNNLTAFKQFDYITDFQVGTDFLDIALPVSLFNSLSSNGTVTSAVIADRLANNTLSAFGDIRVNSHDGSTTLEFVGSSAPGAPAAGAITLVDVTLPNAPGGSSPDINSVGLGDHLHFGSIQQGTDNHTDNFVYNHADNGNYLSAFKEFDHILDFNPLEDNLTIKISDAFYNEINDIHYPGIPPLLPPGAGFTTPAQLANALESGEINSTPIGAQITVTQTPSQYGGGVDSILHFVTGGVVSGAITLHNVVGIAHLTDIPNLVVTH